ncbi:MAG: FeoB-associated Cys-rich membrane protein [Lachnospiraceae bacterium]|nr:FeoB-associated Cys-rich membrane protein [Lachnospiraceae bacterium]
MVDYIIVAVVAAIIGIAVAYIVKEKKRGAKCIGCPVEGTCPHKANGNCSCSGDSKQ